MLKVQLLVPSLKVDASVKTKAKIEEGLELELESDIKVMGATSKQKIELTYGKGILQQHLCLSSMIKFPLCDIWGNHLNWSFVSDGREIEAEVKSEMNTQISSLPNGKIIEKYGNQILDMKVGKTDMKVRHIFRKFVEVLISQK